MAKYNITKSEIIEAKCEMVIDLEISVEEISGHEARSIKALQAKADIPGFRKGHVPEAVIREKMGEAGILEEAVNSWLKVAIPEILEKDAKDAIALPQVTVKKMVPKNPVSLTLTVPLRPKLSLPSYIEIAKTINGKKEAPKDVTDKDVEDALQRLRLYAGKSINPSLSDTPKEEELPPLNDEFAKAVGGGTTIAELKEHIKKDLTAENENKAKEKNRLEIIEAILKETKGAIPQLLTEHELDKMEAEFESDIKRMGVTIEDYLKKTSKTREDLIKEWTPSAEKRARVNLILAEIKMKEKITPSDEEVKHEVEHILEHHKDADKNNVRNYVERMLGNQKAFEWLESRSSSSS